MSAARVLESGAFLGRVGWPLIVALAAPLVLSDFWVSIGVEVGAFAAAAIALSLLVGLAGQLSLAQGTFLGLGMYAVAKSPWGSWAGVAVAVAVAVVAATILGLLLLRLRHFYFALGTLAVGLVAEGLARGYPDELGGPAGLVVQNDAPLGLDTSLSYFRAMWVLVAIVLTAATLLRGSRFGRSAQLVGHEPELAVAVGVRGLPVRLALFVFTSAVAALVGALFGHFLLFVSPAALGTAPNIELLVAVALGGALAGPAALGAVLVGALPHVSTSLAKAQSLILGVALIAVVMAYPAGLRSPRIDLVRRLRPRRAARVERPRLVAARVHEWDRAASPVLAARDLRVSFGGLRAVDEVDLELRPGQILGLIGPNGAGKTTLFSLLAGSLRAQRGRVWLRGVEVTDWKPDRRARAGLARTFQIPCSVPGSTVFEATVVGAHRLGSSGLVRGLVGLDVFERRRLDAVAWRTLDRVGLTDLADAQVESLGTGRRKLLEIARALAGEPEVILLDEPAAGLEAGEASQLALLVGAIAADGVGIALVEHSMDFVMNLCDVVVVMEEGRVIARDVPASVREDPEVVRAYLG